MKKIISIIIMILAISALHAQEQAVALNTIAGNEEVVRAFPIKGKSWGYDPASNEYFIKEGNSTVAYAYETYFFGFSFPKIYEYIDGIRYLEVKANDQKSAFAFTEGFELSWNNELVIKDQWRTEKTPVNRGIEMGFRYISIGGAYTEGLPASGNNQEMFLIVETADGISSFDNTHTAIVVGDSLKIVGSLGSSFPKDAVKLYLSETAIEITVDMEATKKYGGYFMTPKTSEEEQELILTLINKDGSIDIFFTKSQETLRFASDVITDDWLARASDNGDLKISFHRDDIFEYPCSIYLIFSVGWDEFWWQHWSLISSEWGETSPRAFVGGSPIVETEYVTTEGVLTISCSSYSHSIKL